jgi:hypothetical protein
MCLKNLILIMIHDLTAAYSVYIAFVKHFNLSLP